MTEKETGLTPRESWNEGAAAWDDFVESGADYYRHELHAPALLDVCADVSALRVLDLGCGQGFLSRRLARSGANVVGIDLAENQIASAKRHEAQDPLGIEYQVIDATRADTELQPGSFDLVAACMSLQDMTDPAGALRSAFALLKDRGRLAFSVPHPFTDSPYREWERDGNGNKLALKVDRYFDSGMRTLEWNMPRLAYHWETPQNSLTLAEWSELVAAAGFLVRRLHEPRPTWEQVERRPELDDCYRLPYFLIVDTIKA